MARSIELLSGSPLIGSPLVFGVTPSVHQTTYSFHRTQLVVYAMLIIPDMYDGESDTVEQEFKFSTAVDASTTVAKFDISSALRAVADRYQYKATPPQQYPYVKFRLVASDDWMIDGQLYENRGVVVHPGASPDNTYFYYYAFIGRFSDMERLKASGETTQQLSVMTTKPATGVEVVHRNVVMMCPAQFDRGLESDHMSEGATPEFISGAPTDGPKTVEYTPTTLGAQVIGGRSVYVIPAPTDAVYLRFISSKGCLESLHLQCLPKKVVNIHTERYDIARQETFKQFSRATTRKQNDYETWTLSSGPLTEEWASWYIHELLMVQTMWLKRDGQWLLCHVLPDETTTLRDRSKPDMIEVQFSVRIDINGSL